MPNPSDDIQKLAAANAAPTMLCVPRRLPSVPIARNLACNTACARNVGITRTGRWCASNKLNLITIIVCANSVEG